MRKTVHAKDGAGELAKPGTAKDEGRPVGLVLGSILVVALSAAFGASGLIDGNTSGQEFSPRPFDPPSELERGLAAEIALADPRVEEQLGVRYVHLDTTLHTEKRPGVPVSEHPRLFDVWFYDYEADSVVWAVVDAVRDGVVEIVPVDSPLYPPLAEVEVGRAREIALTLDLVTDRFSDKVSPVAAILVSGEGTACPQNRCVALAFGEQGAWRLEFGVLVNLSLGEVDRVLEEDWTEVLRQ